MRLATTGRCVVRRKVGLGWPKTTKYKQLVAALAQAEGVWVALNSPQQKTDVG
jgi:hypothetical protein